MYAVFEEGRINVYEAYLYREVIKEMQGRYWDPERKVWTVPFNAESISTLKVIGCEFKGVLVNMVLTISKDKPQIPVEPVEPMPIRVKPYQHQVQAYNFVGNLLGLFAGGGAN
ncbi:MAG: hypothetical protein QHH10_14400 [Peptococcaceae bacterium]|nr:hypothetical protein [Peptococcaceae bacterium]